MVQLRKGSVLTVLIFASTLFGFASTASAAGLTYSADATFTLTSGTIVIKSGSTAESVVNNGGTLVVGVSGAETVVATSTSDDVYVITNSSSGSVAVATTCITGNIFQVTITSSGGASGNYTLRLGTSFSCGGGSAGSSSGVSSGGTYTLSSPVVSVTPTPTPTPTATPTPAAVATVPAATGSSVSATGAHPDGTLVVNSAGTVYLIKGGKLYGFRSAAEYATWGFTFSQVVKENAADTALPLGGILKAADGSLVLDSSDKRTIYLVDGGQKMGFVSYKVFTGLGYAKSKLFTLNLSDYPAGALVSSASAAHPVGALVASKGTVYAVTAGGQLAPFTSMAVFNSYGYSTAQIVPANAADLALPRTSPVPLRDGTLVSSSGFYYEISDGKALPFSSAASMAAAGYSAANVVPASLSGYVVGTQAF